MIWTHDGALRPAGEKVGIYENGDFRAQIWVDEDFGDSSGSSSATWRYIAIRATEEITSDTIDIAAIIEDLGSRGLIDDQDYLNGYEFGAEVTGGRGKLRLNEISHEFATTANGEASTEVSAGETPEFALV